MQRTSIDYLPRSEPDHGIARECRRIRAGWSQSERERRAGLATVRQFALWESISHGPEVIRIRG